VLKIWGRKNSSNVQKVMWAIGEMGLAHERIDIAGQFGKNREPAYLAMNPNGLVPTLEEDDGFLLWESNSIVRYLAAKHKSPLEPADLRARALASQWMDWQLAVATPALRPVFFGLVRTPAEKRDQAAIETGKTKTTAAMSILNAQLEKTQFVAGGAFSYGDIALGIVVHRYMSLVPERPMMKALDRWYAALGKRPAFVEHVSSIALT
jgi:glutathione S-transferase